MPQEASRTSFLSPTTTFKEKHCTYQDGSIGHFHRKLPVLGWKGKRSEDSLWMYLHRVLLPVPTMETLERYEHVQGPPNSSTEQSWDPGFPSIWWAWWYISIWRSVVDLYNRAHLLGLTQRTATRGLQKHNLHFLKLLRLLASSGGHTTNSLLTPPPSPLPLEKLCVQNPFASSSRR